MAFGDTGEHVILVDGIPFRADGATRDEAKLALGTAMAAAPEMFLQARMQRLGLSQPDADALKARQAIAAEQRAKGQAVDPDAAVRGRSRPGEVIEGMGLNPANLLGALPYGLGLPLKKRAAEVRLPIGKTPITALTGAGRTFREQGQGLRQVMAQVVGDDEAVKAIFDEDQAEQDLFNQLDAQHIGAEDVGQLLPITLEFMLPGAAGANGLMPLIGVGAALGAAEVENDPTLGARATSSAIGAAGAALPAGLSRLFKGTINQVAGAALNVASRSRLYFHALKAGDNTTQLVDDALRNLGSSQQGMQYLGRATLDKVQEIIRSLPQTARKGLLDQEAMGVVRNALRTATTSTPQGVNVFNASAWESSMTELTGKMGSIFTRSAHAKMLVAVGDLARAMQRMQASGVTITPEAAEIAARALVMAPAESGALVKALTTAETVGAQQAYLSAIVDRGIAIGTGVVAPVTGNTITNKVETTYDRLMHQLNSEAP
jgi:hypothetical protein